MKKHIIFDFDDTISASYEHNQQLFVESILVHKQDADQNYLRDLHFRSRGTSMEAQFSEAVKKFGIEVPVKQLVHENELLHQSRINEVKIFDSFEEILRHFKAIGKTISLCTNRGAASLKLILDKNNLTQYFDDVISCTDAGHEKPDPYCLLKLLEKYPQTKKDEVIYFGDSRTDAEFANAAGIDYLVIDHYLNKKQFYVLALDSFSA